MYWVGHKVHSARVYWVGRTNFLASQYYSLQFCALTRAHRSQLVALLGWLRPSLHVVFQCQLLHHGLRVPGEQNSLHKHVSNLCLNGMYWCSTGQSKARGQVQSPRERGWNRARLLGGVMNWKPLFNNLPQVPVHLINVGDSTVWFEECYEDTPSTKISLCYITRKNYTQSFTPAA